MKSGLKHNYWNKYQAKLSTQNQNQYLDYLTDPSFQGVNRLFLPFEKNAFRTGHAGYFLPTVEIKDGNLMIDQGIFFDRLMKKDIRIYKNI